MTRFERAVDQAIAAENRRFLSDPTAVAEAARDGVRMREQMVAQGMDWLAVDETTLREEHARGEHADDVYMDCPECSREWKELTK